MKREIETWEWVCDVCGEKKIVSSPAVYAFQLPEGWGRGFAYGCGSTGYTSSLDLCHACAEKEEGKSKTERT